MRIIRNIIKVLLPERAYSFFLKIYFSTQRQAYYQEIDKRATILMTNIIRHADEISPARYAPYEIHNKNGYYGGSHVLKAYAGFSGQYLIKASLQHGIYFGTVGEWWSTDIVFPIYLVWGAHHKEVTMEKIQKESYIIGSPFFYAESFFSYAKIQSEKLRLGKNLLVFPMHSIPRVRVVYDVEKFISHLRKLKNEFDNIRICLYYSDIQKKIHEKYLENGFECVTAGHKFDINFLTRLKSLIMISDATLSNRVGSYTGYSVYLRKPHRLFCESYDFEQSNLFSRTLLEKIQEENKTIQEDEGYQKIREMFADNTSFKCLPEHVNAVDPYWGFSEVKTKEALREIFMEVEKIYSEAGFMPYR
ncbi:MAG: hypothetical protein LBQ84_05095 [Flavobacteriaceae bacterium]|nr:hypothetical protein [Flavobacteriaceae bacterium]